MPWFDYITGALGEQNPAQAIGDYSDEQQRQNRAAIGLDANGNPLPAGAGATTQLSPGAQGAAAAQASSTLPPNQEPNATKTPVSLGHLIMNLAQYEQREQGFNQAMGMGFAAFAQPRDRQAVSQMFNTTPIDAAKYGQTVMNVGSQQQGQDRANAIGLMVNDTSPAGQAKLADLARSLNMDPVAVRAMATADPGKLAGLIAAQGTPTPTMSNLTGITTFLKNEGASPADIARAQSLIATGMFPQDAQSMIMDEIAYRKENGTDPPWINSPAQYQIWKKEQGDIAAARGEAVDKAPATGRLMDNLQDQVDGLKQMSGMKSLMDDQSATGQARRVTAQNLLDHPQSDWNQIIKGSGLAFSPQELQFLSQLSQIKGEQYSQAIQSMPHNRFSTQEVEGVSKSLGQIGNLSMFGPTAGPDGKPIMGSTAYASQAINPLSEDVKGFRANNVYGASQTFDQMPDDLKPYVNPLYLPGGKLNEKGSGAEGWANSVKITPEEIATAKSMLTQGYTRSAVDRWVRSQGVRPSGY
jgi:hypothetical protein